MRRHLARQPRQVIQTIKHSRLCIGQRVRGRLFDAERCLLNLYRKGLPMEKLKKKAQEYVEGGLLSDDAGKLVCKTLENEIFQNTMFLP